MCLSRGGVRGESWGRIVASQSRKQERKVSTVFSFFHPVLVVAARVGQEIGYQETANLVADELGMSRVVECELTKGERYERYVDRTYWACTYLVKAGLLDNSRPGYVIANAKGDNF